MSRSMVRWELALAGVVFMTQTAVAQVAQTPQGWPGVDPPPCHWPPTVPPQPGQR